MRSEDELKVLENSIRDINVLILYRKFEENWTDKLKISTNRIDKWKDRRETEEKELRGIILDSRLIYYSDFYGFCTIIEKHWDDGLNEVSKDIKSIEIDLKELANYEIRMLIGENWNTKSI